jgi:dienelactone hydrolase
MVRARIALESLYRPIRHIPNIRVPVLYLAATNDTILPLKQVTAALNKTPDGQMYTVKTGHFSVYSGLPFPYLVQHTVGFLRDANGMERMIMSSAEAAGLGRPAPHMEHRTIEPAAQEEAKQEREALLGTTDEL